LLNGISAVYDESASSAYTGHGLYLNAPYGSGALEFRIQFTDPLPVGSGRNYVTNPAINLLGKTTRIDYKTAVNQSMYIYTGTPTTMLPGDEVTTTDGYAVHLDSITNISGTYYAIYTATDPSGTTETSTYLPKGFEYSFFANKVSVRVEFIASSTTITTVTSGKQLFTDGAAFPLDSGWTVKHVEVSGGTVNGYLNYIALKYGSVTNPPMFSGTVQTGLASGIYIDGPKMADGTTKYRMRLSIFPGSTSSVIDSTGMFATGVGSTPNHLLKVSWPARDGSSHTLDAALPDYVVIPSSNSQASFNTAIGARWMIVNDKVVYLKSVESTGTGTQYNVKLAFGGVSGTEVTVGPFANASAASATLTYASAVNPTSCMVVLGSSAGMDLTNVTLFASGTAMSNVDSQSPACDVYPDLVPFGIATQMASGTGTPFMDLRFIQGRSSQPNAVKVNMGGVWKNWPVILLTEPNSAEKALIVYDSEAGTDGLTGLKVYKDVTGTQGADAMAFDPTSAFSWINQAAATTVYENNLYDFTPFSALIDGGTKGTVYFTIPEARKNAIFEVSKDSTSYPAELSALTSGISHFQTAVSSFTITNDLLPTILQKFTTNVTTS
jgi:hypothetical protein